MKNTKEPAVLPYNVAKIRDHYLITTLWGGWVVLDNKDFRKFNSLNFFSDSNLTNRLKKSRILLNDNNLDKVIEDYRQLHSNLFFDTGLHIAVVTDNCNLGCVYCQTRKRKIINMSLEVATGVLACLFASNNQNVRLEFQGGEPLLNWPAVKFLIENSRKQNKIEKKI